MIMSSFTSLFSTSSNTADSQLGWSRYFMPLLLMIILSILTMSQTFAAERLALVIGNDGYENVTSLKKAVNDARAIGDVLTRQGFEVTFVENADRRSMNRAIQRFAAKLEPGDDAVFFYAGHGIEITGRNFILPTDIPAAKPGEEEFIKSEALPVARILNQIRDRGTRATIMILDACRDNPFPKAGSRSLGGSRGFASMPPAEGTFIMYSAGVGQSALDRLSDEDPNPNSVFTRSLIPLLQKPGMTLTQAAKQVRRDVKKLASKVSHDQRPAYYDEITGEFFFAGEGTPDNSQSENTNNTTVTPPVVSPSNEAAIAWQAIQNSSLVGDFMAFKDSFPGTFYARLAQSRIDELQKATQSANLDNNVSQTKNSSEKWFAATYLDLDLFGGDIGRGGKKASTVRQCISLCGREPMCKAFTYNSAAKRCFLKSEYQYAQKYSGALTGVFFRGASGADAPTFNAIWEVLPKTELLGIDLHNKGVKNFSTCSNLCDAVSGCSGFTFEHITKNRHCWLKSSRDNSSIRSQSTKRGITSARRVNILFHANTTTADNSR